MRKLHEIAKLIRSKNAGPFVFTLDVIFPDSESYEKVLATGALDREEIARLYKVQTRKMRRFELPLANAVKFSFPRQVPSGDFLDEDLYGCQQHAPLVMLNIPL